MNTTGKNVPKAEGESVSGPSRPRRSGLALRAGFALALLAAAVATASALNLAQENVRAASRDLARRAHEASQRGDHAKALLWALAGVEQENRLWAGGSGEARTELLRAYGRNRLSHVLRGHTFPVTSVTFSPDGKSVLTASLDRTVKLWDAETGELRKTLTGDELPLSSAEIQPVAGNAVITAGFDKALIRDLNTGRIRTVLKGHDEGPVHYAGYSPDGARAVTTSYDTARLWDAETGRLLHTLRVPRARGTEGGMADIEGVSFSPDGSRLVTASGDGSAQIWNVTTGELQLTLSGPGSPLTTAVFSPSGRLVAAAGRSGTVLLWDAVTGRPICTFAGHGGHVDSVAFSPASDLIATVAQDDMARLWETASCRPIRTFAGRPSGDRPTPFFLIGRRALFSPDGTRLLTTVSGGRALLWDISSGGRLDFGGHAREVTDAAFSPDGRRVATASQDGTARLWNLPLPDLIAMPEGHNAKNEVHDLAFGPRGRTLATASADGTARLWEARTGKPKHVLRGHKGAVGNVAFDGAGARLITVSEDRTARIWDVASGRQLAVLEGEKKALNRALLNEAGDRALTVSVDNSVSLWDTASGRLLASFRQPDTELPGGVMDIAFSPRGPRVLTADQSGSAAILRNVETAKRLLTVQDSNGYFVSGAFSRRGTHLVTSIAMRGDGGGIARIWDAGSGAAVMSLTSGEDFSGFLDFDWNRRYLIARHTEDVGLWDIESGKRRRLLRGHPPSGSGAALLNPPDLVFTLTLDGEALLWDVRSGRVLRNYSEKLIRVRHASVGPDGRLIATASDDNRIRLWEVAPIYGAGLQEHLRMACAMAARTGVSEFSETERKAGALEGVIHLCGGPAAVVGEGAEPPEGAHGADPSERQGAGHEQLSAVPDQAEPSGGSGQTTEN